MLRRVQSPARPFPRWLKVLAVLQLLFLLAVGAAYWLTFIDPSWWREAKPDAAAAQTAEQVENGVVSQLSLARPADPKQTVGYQSEPWSVSISDKDANDWLATRFKPWLENQGGRWPQQLVGVQVAFSPDIVRAGVRLSGVGGGRVLSIEARPQVRPDGSLWLTPAGMGAGAVPLPTALVLAEARSEVIERLPAASRAQAERVLDVLAGRAPALNDAAVKLDDGRRVRLLRIRVLEGRTELTCRTEKE